MAFSVVIKSPMKHAERISRSLGVYAGQITIASYATTLIECTAITKFFKTVSHTDANAALFPNGIISVSPDAMSELGYAFSWDATTGAFRCYSPGAIVFTGTATGAAISVTSAASIWTFAAASKQGTHQIVGIEAIADDAVGTVSFIAIGFI